MDETPHLDIAHVQHLLGTRTIGQHIRHEVECTSTNDLAKEMMKGGAPSGTVIVAESQTAGRGRFQRAWTSAASENLLYTVIVRWPREGFSPPWLTLAAALSVRQTVDELYRLGPSIKWPNDVVLTLGRGVQKLAGVLTEATSFGEDEMAAAVGVGLNVNQVWTPFEQEPRIPRVSMAAALGQAVDREPLLAACLAAFEERFQALSESRANDLVREAREHLTGKGQHATVEIPGRRWVGTIEDIDDAYHLQIRDDQGELQTVTVGEVLLGENPGDNS